VDKKDIALLERETEEVKPGITAQELRARMRRFLDRARKIKNDLNQKQREIEKQFAALGTASSHARGARMVAEMQTAEGGAWSGAELAEHFNLSAAVLHRRRREHRIIYWRDAQHDYFYPKWQFNEAGALLPGVKEVLQLFMSQDEWRVMRYFLGTRTQLGNRRPLDLLRAGKVEAVVKHAHDHAAENTW
jgi:hypothetical protein